MTNNLVSVIIPTWNRGHCIEKTINSATSQTYRNIEILVCDDGSTDNTESIVKKIIKNDRRVKWLPGNHSGKPAIARNSGILNASGEWLAFQDSDDLWVPDKISLQLQLAERHSQLAICSNAFRIVDDKSVGNYLAGKVPNILDLGILLKTNYVICSSVMIKKDLVVKAGMFPTDDGLIALEDYALWLRVASAKSFFYIDKPLLKYRDQPDDSIRSSGRSGSQQRRVILLDYVKWLYKQTITGKMGLAIQAVRALL